MASITCNVLELGGHLSMLVSGEARLCDNHGAFASRLQQFVKQVIGSFFIDNGTLSSKNDGHFLVTGPLLSKHAPLVRRRRATSSPICTTNNKTGAPTHVKTLGAGNSCALADYNNSKDLVRESLRRGLVVLHQRSAATKSHPNIKKGITGQ
ncbi:hypothetical protein [Sphingorhabdus sp. YGSMI21]|uniref:hypothetical protein n=1 Tax=Sphingorhabdus sp. YGSMI21 TaxID=2077182 RepID=UPI000F4D4AEE|nr:hypothetical protein [Sphingorhabdus sp. YGSMI21]